MPEISQNAIKATNGTGTAISLTPASNTCTANITNNLSHRNLIINGACSVTQRSSSSTANGYGSLDRYAVYSGGTDELPTHAQITLTSSDTGPWAKGFSKALQITNGNQTSGAGAADSIELQTSLEGQDICNSGWVPTDTNSKLTISYWAKSSVAQTFYMRFRVFASSEYEYTYSVALSANTWTKVTKAIPGNSNFSSLVNTNAKGLLHSWALFNGTDQTNNKTLDTWAVKDNANKSPDCTSTWYTTNDSTFALTGVQLEVGDHATDFEHRSYADELHRCRRYYLQFGATGMDGDFVISASQLASNGDQTRPGLIMNPQLRAAPTMTEFGDGLNIYGSGSVTPVTAISDITYNAQSSLLGFNCECADIGDNYEIVTVTNRPSGGVKIECEL